MKLVSKTKNYRKNTIKIYVHSQRERNRGASMGFCGYVYDDKGNLITSSNYFMSVHECKNALWFS